MQPPGSLKGTYTNPINQLGGFYRKCEMRKLKIDKRRELKIDK